MKWSWVFVVVLTTSDVRADAGLLAAYKASDYRDIKKLNSLFYRFVSDINVQGKQTPTEELTYAADMASCLWNVTEDSVEQKKIAEIGFKLAQVLYERDPGNIDAVYFMGLNLLMHSQSKGVLDTLFSLRKVKHYLEQAAELDPRYLYSSPDIGLGALYLFAPGFPVAFGDIDKAGKLLLEVGKREPRQTTPWLLLGAVYSKQRDRERAIESFRKVRKVPPWNKPTTMVEKDMDFWWHVDQIRAVRGIRIAEQDFDPKKAFEMVDSASRGLKDDYLPKALQAEIAK